MLILLFSLLATSALAARVEVFQRNNDEALAYTLNGSVYYTSSPKTSAAVGVYEVKGNEDAWVPFTILITNATTITDSVLQSTLSEYANDDVWTTDFLSGIQIQSTVLNSSIDASALSYLATLGSQYVLLDSTISCTTSNVTAFDKSSITPPGPYLGKVSTGKLALYKTYGTFYDSWYDFVSGVTSTNTTAFSYAHIWYPEQFEKVIPYTSRLYSSLLDSVNYPLKGLRFAIKDIINLEGIIQAGGSREYARLYNTPKNSTAPAMQQLIDMGATPIGMTKAATFAWGAWPDQNIDVPYPWNPRADGYLGLSASSHGSAGAIAAYDVLDFVIGTDTGGSVRNPADRAGVYGLRPTHGAIDVEGVITSAYSLDAVGFLTRSPYLAHKLALLWEGSNNTALIPGSFTYPKKIIYPIEWFPVNSSAAQTLIDTWLHNVTTALNMSIVYQNTSDLFHSVVNTTLTMQEWSSNISSVNIKDNWDTLGRQFVEDFGKQHDGRWPELDSPVRTAWNESLTYSESYYQENLALGDQFTEFWNGHVVTANNETCSDGLWIYQIADTGGGIPEYRDRTLDYFPDYTGAMRGASIAPFAKTVDITVPIGQVPYQSVISHHEEQLTITLNFVAHKGCDVALMEFVRACAEVGYCKEVKTGREAF